MRDWGHRGHCGLRSLSLHVDDAAYSLENVIQEAGGSGRETHVSHVTCRRDRPNPSQSMNRNGRKKSAFMARSHPVPVSDVAY